MNRHLFQGLQVMAMLLITSAAGASVPAIASAGEKDERLKCDATAKTVEAEPQNRYNESKYFPGKGKYVDWIQGNKLSNQGIRLSRAGKYRLAVPKFQKAIQLYGYDYSYYMGLGGALEKLGNLDRAQSATEMATQLAPRRWGPWYVLGLILTKEKEYKLALTSLKKARSLKAPATIKPGMNQLIIALERKLKEVAPGTNAADTGTNAAPSAGSAVGSGSVGSGSVGSGSVGSGSVGSGSTSAIPKANAPVSTSQSPTDTNSINQDSTTPISTGAHRKAPNSVTQSNPYTTLPEVSPTPPTH